MTMTLNQKLAQSKRTQDLHQHRHETFKSAMDKNDITLNALSKQLNYSFILADLQAYYEGARPIVRNTSYEKLMKAIDLLVKNKPNNDIINEANMHILHRNGNLLLGKKFKKEVEHIKSFLSHLELDCRVIIAQDGCLILENKKVFKTQFAKGKLI